MTAHLPVRPLSSAEFSQWERSLPPAWPPSACDVSVGQPQTIVIDDDATGTQTVSSIRVALSWDVETLRHLVAESKPFWVLTNSRAVPENRACTIARELITNLSQAGISGRALRFISRSDSTLRGHFPAEVDSLRTMLQSVLGLEVHAVVLIPALIEAGRITADNVHWVQQDDWYIPAGQTEFARDPTFAYRSSHLKEWVLEKTRNAIQPDRVTSLSLELVRAGADAIARVLEQTPPGGIIIANATTYDDLSQLARAFRLAEASGRYYIYRSAASWVRALTGIKGRMLSPDEIVSSNSGGAGGLIVIGSHVAQTNVQIEHLSAHTGITRLELDVVALLDNERWEHTVQDCASLAGAALSAGQDVAIVTSREVLTHYHSLTYLEIGERITSALTEIVSRVSTRPRYLLVKGGITSSSLAAQGLGCTVAEVAGQIQPGVPVWSIITANKWQGLPYIVYPGNVGPASGLAQAVQELWGA